MLNLFAGQIFRSNLIANGLSLLNLYPETGLGLSFANLDGHRS